VRLIQILPVATDSPASMPYEQLARQTYSVTVARLCVSRQSGCGGGDEGADALQPVNPPTLLQPVNCQCLPILSRASQLRQKARLTYRSPMTQYGDRVRFHREHVVDIVPAAQVEDEYRTRRNTDESIFAGSRCQSLAAPHAREACSGAWSQTSRHHGARAVMVK
jgi:hypothetical protein